MKLTLGYVLIPKGHPLKTYEGLASQSCPSNMLLLSEKTYAHAKFQINVPFLDFFSYSHF